MKEVPLLEEILEPIFNLERGVFAGALKQAVGSESRLVSENHPYYYMWKQSGLIEKKPTIERTKYKPGKHKLTEKALQLYKSLIEAGY